MMKFRLAYIFVSAGLVLGSCSDILHTGEIDPERDERIAFSASNARMITKSGLEYENFEAGTKYLLYGKETGKDWSVGNTVMNKTQSFETEGHLIYYGPDLHFHDKTYDFYGATICSTGDSESDYPTDIAPTESSPVISLSLDENTLDDLMYSNNLKGCNRTSGLMQMNFIHGLSKIQVEVSKQNDSQELAVARIDKITLKGTHSSGQLDIVEGGWSLEGTTDRIFSQTPVTLSTAASMIKDASGNVAEMLIFPNEDNRTLSLEITYSLNGSDPATISCEILDYDGSAFLFEQNHRYTLAVTIANDGVQIVTVLPKVYEWIDIDVPSYLGQPVTFGNLMWMDRNLGALSADYDNDWYNTIGHYFQFGRNIPYILDIEKFKEYTGDKYGSVNFAGMTVYVMEYYGVKNDVTYDDTYYYDNRDTYYTRKINAIAANSYKLQNGTEWNSLDEGQKTELILKAVQCIYTYDHLGRKVYGTQYVEPDSDGTGDVNNKGYEPVQNPDLLTGYTGLTDVQISELYRFGFGTKQPSVASNIEKPTVWTFNNQCGSVYWESGRPDKDPCPKGWRLPTKEDLEVLMPTVDINWDNENYTQTIYYPQTKTTTTEDIRYGKTQDGHHVCYILKNKGTGNAYRLRIMSHFAKDGKDNKRYFSIARYGATSADTDLNKYLDGTPEATVSPTSKETTMWANPIEIIKYPACGFIVPDSDGTPETVHPDLRSFGFGTVIRTSDSNPVGIVESSSEAFSYVQYLSTTDYQLSIQKNSRRSLGDQIRCVRDINAVD